MSDRLGGTPNRSDIATVGDETRDVDALSTRLAAVERAVTDGDEPTSSETGNSSNLDSRLSAVEASLDDVDARLDELEAATQALRGYVGGVRGVNREVERRADAALAAVERIESELGRDHADNVPEGIEPGSRSSTESDTEVVSVDDGDDTDAADDWNELAARFRDVL